MQLFWSIAASRLEGHPIIRIVKMLDWPPAASLLAEQLKPDQPRKGGRVPYEYLPMFRALLLSRWFSLSYGGLAKSLAIRIDFLVFCGFDPLESLPDASTLNRFALRLDALKNAGSSCPFDLVKEQMKTKGIELKPADGTLKMPKVRFRKTDEW